MQLHETTPHCPSKFAARCLDGDPIDTTLLDLLIAHGADPKHIDNDGRTALYFMGRRLRQVEAVCVLLRHGSDVNIVTPGGNIIFHQAMGRGNLEP